MTAATATPAVFAAFAARRRAAEMIAPPRLAYTTTTGDAPRPGRPVAEDNPICWVCNGRVADHFAEHDALVEAGLAAYGRNGSVFRTYAWDDALAAQVAEREYREMQAQFEAAMRNA